MRRFGIGYQAALEAVFAILIGILGGYYVDRWLGSAPVGLLVGVLVGFGSFVLRLVRLTRQLERVAAEDEGRAGVGSPAAKRPGSKGAGSEEREGRDG